MLAGRRRRRPPRSRRSRSAWRTRACSSPTSTSPPRAVDDWKQLRRRRRAHPRALVGDRARQERAVQAGRASTPTTTTTRSTTGRVLDNAVAIVRGAGMQGDAHDHRARARCGRATEPAKRNPRWKPDADGVRGLLAAPSPRATRPQVDRYLLWNEPNQKGWLQPQWQKVSGSTCTPVSPHIYRSLVRAAQPVVKAADPGAEVVIGELAPVGNPPISADTPMRAAAVPALAGLRRRQVQDDQDRRAARASRRPRATRSATTRTRRSTRPTRVNPDLDAGPVRRPHAAVHARIDKLRAAQAPAAVGKTIHLTEFGYETSPPDPARRHLAGAADALPAAGGLHRLGDQARARPVLLPVGRRAGRATSAAAPSATRAGRRACASTTASPSRCSR